MKELITLLCLFLYLLISNKSLSQSKINFLNYEPDSIAYQAQKQGKSIFLYATLKGCMPCKVLEYQVFSDTTLANFVNQNMIAAKLNITDKFGKEEYLKCLDIAKSHHIRVYPTIVILDKNGKEVQRAFGIVTAQGIIKLLQETF
ncbi:thioredoxin fold domain-containing protein [Thermoflexibacter ruber]|uniref:Thioredoxin-related protein n=1 Tax=Thermoflexibacter ruber TaxID=1003 RepID=A0A1I2IKS9_9BACT|nr:thioredoxin family protein [Thermoflexibacter ruber]SFF42290.1 Thioredoxin-related protein [Thermoflexibacter ruber]